MAAKIISGKCKNNFGTINNKIPIQDNFSNTKVYISLKNERSKIDYFEFSNLLWISNFNPTNSYPDYKIGTEWAGKYSIVLNTNNLKFGWGILELMSQNYFSQPQELNGRKNSLQIYIPCRVAIVVL
ncbi:hypothetical protein Glove_454g3 [Diversispora epigaea]|uniref:Alpha-amylase/branching enzyme C-terminal all beta domain-containing protein n=1 Tax=Diversispora epigaea TaxID=1348612 RepID=A0A397GTS7_9GLOM|nr:hypothetical protein Glove_454g3 [Diversispora epigaea]